jgi:anti-sigma regulatory factor (Ser/Thr protein kinase)
MDDPAFQRHSLTLESGRAASGTASAWARALAGTAALSEERAYALDLCIVEIVTNIVDHAYRGGPGQIRIELDLAPGAAILVVDDDGPAFDPMSVPAPVVADSIEDAQVGGFGIHMVRSTADECRYERRAARNVFTARFGRT